MMKPIINPEKKDWKKLLERPAIESRSMSAVIASVMQAVKAEGDEAIKKFELQFDKVTLPDLELPVSAIREAGQKMSPELRAAIALAKSNIEAFHQKQAQPGEKLETMPGIVCWRKSTAIEKVGLYIPGGSAPLFSTLLMLGIPAVIAGCREIILCSPPDSAGNLHPAILYTAGLVGIKRIFRIGGAQAIAAMAYGTETVPAVYKIFGPGNQYVTAAKQWVQQEGVAIDMPAGPSELAVYADASANPEFLAADMLSQAEHGPDSQVVLVCTEENIARNTIGCIIQQAAALPRKNIVEKSLLHSRFLVVDSYLTAMDILNEYAPEHLILACSNAHEMAGLVRNAGSVFIGHYSPETAGDYASGTNHTLPTSGYARAYSGVSLDSFIKKISFQELSREGLQSIAASLETMAGAEGLQAHARAVSIRVAQQ